MSINIIHMARTPMHMNKDMSLHICLLFPWGQPCLLWDTNQQTTRGICTANYIMEPEVFQGLVQSKGCVSKWGIPIAHSNFNGERTMINPWSMI